MLIRLFFILLALGLNSIAKGQSTAMDIEILLEKKEFDEAEKLLDARIKMLFENGDPDTISKYTDYIGRVASAKGGNENAAAKLLAIISASKKRFPYSPLLPSVYYNVADYFSRNGEDDRSFRLLEELLHYFKGKENIIQKRLYKIHSNLGTYAMRMGNYGLSSIHYRQSLRLFASDELSELYIINNSMGIVMWNASKLDSAAYYFTEALHVIERMDSSAINRYQRPAMVLGNISNVYWELGETEKSIHAVEKSAENYKLYSIYADSKSEKEKGLKGHFLSTYNLGISYQELGNYADALELINYTYHGRIKQFGADNPDAYKSLLITGAIYCDTKEYDRAMEALVPALAYWSKRPASIWLAQSFAYLAAASHGLERLAEASAYYAKADSLYNISLNGEYSVEYLGFLSKAANFYASDKQPAKAISVAENSLRYVTRYNGEESLVAVYQLCNLADIYFRVGSFQKTLFFADKALLAIKKLTTKTDRLLDSVMLELKKPLALLLRTKARYELQPKSAENIRSYLMDLEPAITNIERQKNLIADEKDVSSLIAESKSVLDFFYQLRLELYRLTGDESELNDIMRLQEAVIYNRIRSGLERRRSMQFLHVPKAVMEEEDARKQELRQSLSGSAKEKNPAKDYVQALNGWKGFLEKLKIKYPDYYRMRYAVSTGEGHLPGAEIKLQDSTTAIRYLFIAGNLYALVLGKDAEHWIPLRANGLEKKINLLMEPETSPAIVGQVGLELYNTLWQPLEKFILTRRVTIIPDGILYYLSFDMLPVQPANSLQELSVHNLLRKYIISYNYSLSALGATTSPPNSNKGISAFVPGFSDKLKEEYRQAYGKDAVLADENYLALIPLPFSVDLARKAYGQFGGELFIGENSTREVFKSKAGGHLIIHVGTHAEANNMYPEYSRLIFARNPADVAAENQLYLHELYNCDLSSELTVLTACETGRPAFYPGEGMISMAHAFNYAGSNSILTGLWKIDEQSSTIIIGYFYEFLQDGLSKDEALQQAKIKYLSEARGRMIGPQYWAGLVIMGDVSPIRLAGKTSFSSYWLMLLILPVLLLFFYWKKR